jgi:2-methylaconitate cis-trans-isomerase PrpF
MNQLVEVINQDVVVTSGNLVVTKTLIGQAEDLAAEHEAFNTNYVIGGRQALYSLLGKIAALVEQFDAAVDKDELLEIVRTQLQEQYGIKTQHNTSDITVLVRYITPADRKTAHVYTRAIETARANQIAPAHFAGYLEQAGGVERIRAVNVNRTTRINFSHYQPNATCLKAL